MSPAIFLLFYRWVFPSVIIATFFFILVTTIATQDFEIGFIGLTGVIIATLTWVAIPILFEEGYTIMMEKARQSGSHPPR